MGGVYTVKKLVFFAFIFIILFITFPAKGVSNPSSSENAYQVIPDDAIRLRILANSDEEDDQNIKRLVRDEVSDQISGWVQHMTDIDEARQLIKERIPEITAKAEQVLQKESNGRAVEVEYGENVTFPVKLYDTFLYPAGEYEAVLITIGEGKGANWWCVLFPPLCFLDFSSGTSVASADDEDEIKVADEQKDEEAEKPKVKFFLFEWFGWT